MKKPSDELIKRVMQTLKGGDFTTEERASVMEALGGYSPPEWILHGPMGVTHRPAPATTVVKDLLKDTYEAMARGGLQLAKGVYIRPHDMHKHFAVSLVEFGSARLIEEIEAGGTDPLQLILVKDSRSDDDPVLYGPRRFARCVNVMSVDAGDPDPSTGNSFCAQALSRGEHPTWTDYMEL